MTDWPGALARAFQQHLAGGSGGSAGSHRGFDRPSRGIGSRDPGTSSPNPLVPVVPETNPPAAHAVLRTTATTAHSRMVSGQGRQEDTKEQSFAEPRTPGTAGTTKIEQLRAPQNDAFEESAAIIEYNAGVRRSWAESFARLNIADQPPGFRHQAWCQLIDDSGRFLDCWSMEAARLGWSVLDVFGVHPAAPSTTFNAIGLVPLIRGGDVVAIGSDRATIRTQGGTLLTYLHRPQPGAVAVWELVDTSTASHRVKDEVRDA